MEFPEPLENPYLLLTPGPLTTTASVKAVMLRDWCTWDEDYNRLVQEVRRELTALATHEPGYTCVLIQGSGTFGVEAAVTTAVPEEGKLLVLANGAYGRRIAHIAQRGRIAVQVVDSGETSPPDIDRMSAVLQKDPSITHVAVVHCETTTGMLNPVEAIGRAVKSFGRVFIVDAMSSFGGIPLDAAAIGADYLISSANKCIQGVPGFSFVVARRQELEKTKGRARSLSLDLYDQWATMENHPGKWRFTSPTHVVRAFYQALHELAAEGGVAARNARYRQNRDALVAGMQAMGFMPLLPPALRSPIITAFHSPSDPAFDFRIFYDLLKKQGFVIYPGKVTELETFRIGTIGDVHPADIERLLKAVDASMYWKQPGA
ncbi:MAG: 2-aminoethylphosphonate--pyruvate transaminase [Desulfobacterales bacterium]|jgi:2-aminoethylphosphonate-pyruvate transaminase|nr:2-aminoethylphosphonate--pyruvate transaminase [Desulfobacterales bacterium]